MKSVWRNILFVVCYISLSVASENKPVATNRDILFALCDSVIDNIVAHTIQHSSITLKINPDTFTIFFRQQFITELDSKHITVFEQAASETTLELSVQESSVFFGELFTDSFGGRKKSERTTRLMVNATLSSSTKGNILWSKQFAESIVDTVNYADIEQMNNSSPPMTSYHKPELSFFDSVLEPAIVIFSTGVAVYLFFTIRS